MDPPASAPATAPPPAAVPAKRPAPTANASAGPPAKRQAGAVTVTSLHDHALDLLDIHNDATHVLAPKETPTQRLIARIRHLDFQQLAPHDEDDEDDDDEDEADGAAKTDQEYHDHEESDGDNDDDHAMSVATSRAPTTAVSTAAAASSAPALDQVAKSPEEMERLGAELIQHLDMASHEIWALRELVTLLLESPTVPPGVPPAHAHLFKVVHPIHFPKPRMPAAARLDETAFATAAKRSHLSAGAALLRRGARSLRASLRAEHAFFVDEALPLRDRNWRLRLRTDVAVDARGPTRVFGGGMYVDYRYDHVEAACAPAARERLPAPPRAELLRVLRDQVVGKDKEMVSVADGLQVTLGAGGGDPQRIRVAWIGGGKGSETTSKDAVAAPTAPPTAPAPTTAGESKVDAHLRAAQETYYHRLLFAQLCEDAATVPNVSHRGKSLVVTLGAHGGVSITLGAPPATPTLEEHVLARGTSLSRFVEWLQFTHASRAVVETVAHTAHAITPWTAVRVATRRVPAARDADEGLVVRVEVPATGAELDLAVHPPAEMTVRIPASGRHVVVGDVAQVAQLVQYQVADEVRALVREKAKALGVRRCAAVGDGEDDDEEGAEGGQGGAVKVHVEWPGEDEVGKPARVVVDGVAAPLAGGSGWVERALLQGSSRA
ncbi:hypothetical protein GGF32_008330 [Allomyces javanicus]|nr:hypothetical protein GGF32_008330 [Allomyces javanicus]